MGFGTNSVIDDKLSGLVVDSDDLLYKLSHIDFSEKEFVEIASYLPSRPDIDIVMSYVRRWLEVQKYYNKPLRVFAWCWTPIVEKRITQLTVGMEDILVTTLPLSLKEDVTNVK